MTRPRPLLWAALALTGLLAACTQTGGPSPADTSAAPASTAPSESSAAPAEPAASSAAVVEPAEPPGGYPFTLTDLPVIDGSTATIPLATLALQRVTGMSEAEAANIAVFSTTPYAYRNLAQGQVDLILAYAPDANTLDVLANYLPDEPLESHAIGRDALVFLTHAANPVDNLTTADIQAIYQAGPTVTNWAQVGGQDSPIVAYQRPTESGSQALMVSLVMGDRPMDAAPTQVATSMGALVDAVGVYRNDGTALGYSVYYYVSQMYGAPDVKVLAVDGVDPSNQSIADGSYPFVHDFYAVIRAGEPEGSPARRLLDWFLSDEGRQAVADAGYVAV